MIVLEVLAKLFGLFWAALNFRVINNERIVELRRRSGGTSEFETGSNVLLLAGADAPEVFEVPAAEEEVGGDCRSVVFAEAAVAAVPPPPSAASPAFIVFTFVFLEKNEVIFSGLSATAGCSPPRAMEGMMRER